MPIFFRDLTLKEDWIKVWPDKEYTNYDNYVFNYNNSLEVYFNKMTIGCIMRLIRALLLNTIFHHSTTPETKEITREQKLHKFWVGIFIFYEIIFQINRIKSGRNLKDKISYYDIITKFWIKDDSFGLVGLTAGIIFFILQLTISEKYKRLSWFCEMLFLTSTIN